MERFKVYLYKVKQQNGGCVHSVFSVRFDVHN
jgi:hypothetical protein